MSDTVYHIPFRLSIKNFNKYMDKSDHTRYNRPEQGITIIRETPVKVDFGKKYRIFRHFVAEIPISSAYSKKQGEHE